MVRKIYNFLKIQLRHIYVAAPSRKLNYDTGIWQKPVLCPLAAFCIPLTYSFSDKKKYYLFRRVPTYCLHSCISVCTFSVQCHNLSHHLLLCSFGSQSQDCCWFSICQTQSIFHIEVGRGEWIEQRTTKAEWFYSGFSQCGREKVY